MISLRSLCLLSVLALTSNALAETVAVSPPVNNGVDPKVALGMHQLIASEVEYFGDVESGVDLEQKPGSLTNGCLSSTSCLRTITNAAGTDWLVAGAIFNDGSNIKMDYLLYDKNVGKVIRRNTWIVPGDPSMMADAMTPVLRELLTGQSPEQDQQQAVAASDFDTEPEDDFEFNETGDPEIDDLMTEDPLAGTAMAPAPYTPPPAPAPAPVAAPAPAPVDTSASDDELASMITFGGAAPAPAPTPEPTYAAPAPTPADAAVNNAAMAAANQAATMLDESEGRVRQSSQYSGDEMANITLRGGMSKYYSFLFFTGGAELGVAIPGLPINIVAGMEVYAVQRNLPPEIQIQTGQLWQWNTIYPMNLGVLYRIDSGGPVRPYVGADMIMAQYYRDEIGADWAGGARARGGVDVFVSDNFGLNVNLAVGGWLGQNWPYIEPGVQRSGLLPQASAGTVLRF